MTRVRSGIFSISSNNAPTLSDEQASRGAFVRFAAENLVLVNAEHIEKILILACSFRDKVLQHSLNRIELTGVDFKVRMQADEV